MDKGIPTTRPARQRDQFRRLPAYLYLADLYRGRRVVEVGSAEGAAAYHLARTGATSVVGVEREAAMVEQARTRYRAGNLSFVHAEYTAIDVQDRSVDVAFVPGGEDALRAPGFLEEMRRIVSRAGHLVMLCASGDRPLARGVAYHDLVARLTPIFGGVRMVGVSPLVGFALVEFADDEELAELELDTTLAALGSGRDPVCDYIAVAGPVEGPVRGYMAVELPPADGLIALAAARGGAPGAGLFGLDDEARARAQALETELDGLRARMAQAEEDVGRVTATAARELEEERHAGEAARTHLAAIEADLERLRGERQELAWRAADLEEKLVAREDEIGAMKLESAPLEVIVKAAEAHQLEMEQKQAELHERDAYIEELQGELEEVAAAHAQAAQAARDAAARAGELETEVRDLRSRLARAEGLVLKASLAGPGGGDGRAAELEEALAEKTRAADKHMANWKEAEAKTDELWRKIGEMQKELVQGREQAVENARAQRQAAQIALTRAVDEASRKMVSVQDLQTRTERERAELERQVTEMKAQKDELEAARADAESRAQGAAEETSAARELAAAEITRLREELARAQRGREAPPESSHVEGALRQLEEEVKDEETRIAEIERTLRMLGGEPTSYT